MDRPLLVDRTAWQRIGRHDRALRVAHYVEDSYRTGITLQGAATAVDMERTALSRFFKRRSGIGFWEFVRAYRLGEAVRLMTVGNYPLKEVASTVGFGSLASLERASKRFLGVSPSRYRKRLVELYVREAGTLEARRPHEERLAG